MLAYAEGRLTAWPDCRLARRRADAPKFTPLEVLIPAAAPRPLPTLDASLCILGQGPATPGQGLDDQRRMARVRRLRSCHAQPGGRDPPRVLPSGVRARQPVGTAPDRRPARRAEASSPGDGQLATTKDLTMGQAGRVVEALTGCRSLQDLYAAADPGRTARQRARMRARLVRVLAVRAHQPERQGNGPVTNRWTAMPVSPLRPLSAHRGCGPAAGAKGGWLTCCNRDPFVPRATPEVATIGREPSPITQIQQVIRRDGSQPQHPAVHPMTSALVSRSRAR